MKVCNGGVVDHVCTCAIRQMPAVCGAVRECRLVASQTRERVLIEPFRSGTVRRGANRDDQGRRRKRPFGVRLAAARHEVTSSLVVVPQAMRCSG
jgi:hypothetical protein